MQPFVSYASATGVSYTINSESTYNRESNDWRAPLNFIVGKVSRLGTQMILVNAGIRYYVSSMAGGPEGFGARLVVVLLFPREELQLGRLRCG